jgi:uncharacterized protein
VAVAEAPAAPAPRYETLDVLRGFAVLGILVMNVQSFGLIAAAYANPTAYGDLTGLNLLAWLGSHVLAEQKFMSLFALLFGAGIVLIAEGEERAGRAPAQLHGRRMAWLMLFGLCHGYLLWYGDILFSYALCGALVYPMWRQPPQRLLTAAALFLLVPSLVWGWQGMSAPAPDTQAYRDMQSFWQPTPADVAAEEAAYRGGWGEQMHDRAPMMTWMILSLPFDAGWRIAGLMLAGMALLKLGALSGELPRALYRRWLFAGLALGLPLILFGVYRNFSNDWALGYALYFGSQYNYWGSLAVCAGYAAGLILLVRQARAPRLRLALAAVGRMAFTNYLMQTLICTTLFYGHGLGWFGRLERVQLLGMVVAVWLVQIAFSLYWMRRHRFGPCEWLWRSLSRGALQPWYR